MRAGSQGRIATVLLRRLSPCIALSLAVSPALAQSEQSHRLFQPSTRCVACHNKLIDSRGKDLSIGQSWRPTMMANSARDPYWQAGVRREVTEHSTHAAAIQDECSKCHMPMATTTAHANGKAGVVFAHFSAIGADSAVAEDALARDGVSCSLCHQIQPTLLGHRKSMVGGFAVDAQTVLGRRKEYGPYSVDAGRAEVMRSASRFLPMQGNHMGAAELCATCHTLYTHALDAEGKVVGELPEQVPYQEWLHSSYRAVRSCQDCHMPSSGDVVSVASVAGVFRSALHRHDFVGGNFFMQSLFGRFGSELAALGEPAQFDLAAFGTREHLEQEAADLTIERIHHETGKLSVAVCVKNRSGHKLPTAYPSRRAWIHLTVRTTAGRVVFESGALRDNGSIVGNDNDRTSSQFEPHHQTIEQRSQVAIYEAILGRPDGRVTTGLLEASNYLKDNRLLPVGFDKHKAPSDVAVHGAALDDPDFAAGQDTVTYRVAMEGGQTSLVVEAELLYQPIGFRWADNLRGFGSFEPQRFVGYYAKLSRGMTAVLARSVATTTP